MKIEGDLKLTITRLEDSTDHEGYAFLKAKGYCSYKTTTPRGRRIVAYDQFAGAGRVRRFRFFGNSQGAQ
jgi:hypothetical protein